MNINIKRQKEFKEFCDKVGLTMNAALNVLVNNALAENKIEAKVRSVFDKDNYGYDDLPKKLKDSIENDEWEKAVEYKSGKDFLDSI